MKTTTLDIPSLGYSALCPVSALLGMLDKITSNADSPLFQVPHGPLYRPLTDSAARKHLKSVSTLLGVLRPLTMIFVGVGLLGLFRVGYLFRKSRPKVLGLQTVSRGTFHSLHPIHHKSLMPLGPTSSPSLRPLLLLLIVWAPVTYHINSISQ